MLRIAMDCSSITDFQQSTAISIAKKFRNLHIGKTLEFHQLPVSRESQLVSRDNNDRKGGKYIFFFSKPKNRRVKEADICFA